MYERIWLKPRYCPMCGAKIDDIVTGVKWESRDAALSRDYSRMEIVYDCYCNHCKWSGFIEPDAFTWEEILDMKHKLVSTTNEQKT